MLPGQIASVSAPPPVAIQAPVVPLPSVEEAVRAQLIQQQQMTTASHNHTLLHAGQVQQRFGLYGVLPQGNGTAASVGSAGLPLAMANTAAWPAAPPPLQGRAMATMTATPPPMMMMTATAAATAGGNTVDPGLGDPDQFIRSLPESFWGI